jgi:hypothetical protein
MRSSTTVLIASLVLFALLLVLCSFLHAQVYTLETENLRLIYFGKAQEYLVPYVAQTFENSLRFYSDLFGYSSKEKITLLIHDFGDFGNAGAGTVPRNHIVVTIAPYDYSYETTPANERMNSTMNHEMVHIVTMDKAVGSDVFFRRIFGGKVHEIPEQPLSMIYGYLTTPRRSSPRWYREGMAVFMETWTAGGLGRALGAYDEMVFRTRVHENAHIYSLVGLESEGTKIDFQIGVNAYLYGTRFLSYMALQHGPEKLLEWYARYDGSRKYFSSQFEAVYQMSMGEAWSRWITWERGFQQANLDSIRAYPVTPHRQISHPLGSVSRGYFDPETRQVYVGVNYPGQMPHIAAIDLDTGEMEKIHDIKGAALFFVTSLAYDPSSKTLFYTTDNNEWRDLCVLDLESRTSRRLIKDARVGDLAFNRTDQSLWGVRRFNGISTLVRIPYPYDEWNQIYSFPYGKDIYDIDVSPDGSRVTAGLSEISGRQTLIAMQIDDLMEGDPSYSTIFDFENSIPSNFVFSADGKHSYGSSYYSGVANIYRYDWDVNDIWVTSNCETGVFRPIPVSGDSLIVFRYTSEGFVPCVVSAEPLDAIGNVTFLGQQIVERHPVVTEWIIDSPASVDIVKETSYEGKYRPVRNIRLNSVYPIVEGYKDYGAVGLHANVSGPIGLNNLDLTVSYTPSSSLSKNERTHAAAYFSHRNWELKGTVNRANFYDLFGPTKTSRKGYSLGGTYKRKLLLDQPRTMDLRLDIDGWGDLETLPQYQNIASTSSKLLTGGVRLDYSHQRASLGAVDYEQGIKWRVATNSYYAQQTYFPRIYANFDFGLPLPIHHSSLWLRTSFGKAFGDASEPYGNFFFGGFRNNWVDYQSAQRYREFYTFPGVEIDDIAAQNYTKFMLEWNLPPKRFRRMGLASFYNTWARPALFSSVIVSEIDDSALRRTVANVGGQIDFRFVALSHLKFTISLGYAGAFEDHRKFSDEFMFSLKIH